MVSKIINATEAKVGTNIILDGDPYTVKSMDVSKTGKHGAHKCRIEAVGMINPKHKKDKYLYFIGLLLNIRL